MPGDRRSPLGGSPAHGIQCLRVALAAALPVPFVVGGCAAAPASTPGWTAPIVEYSHADGRAVSGPFVQRGSAIPGLVGTYLYADYCSGRVWGIPAAGGRKGGRFDFDMTPDGTGRPAGAPTSAGRPGTGPRPRARVRR